MTDSRDDYRLDRTAFSVVPLDEQDDDGAYWATKTPEERMRALEFLRWMAYGDAATARIQKVFSVGKLDDA
jgi:hypothetical protein